MKLSSLSFFCDTFWYYVFFIQGASTSAQSLRVAVHQLKPWYYTLRKIKFCTFSHQNGNAKDCSQSCLCSVRPIMPVQKMCPSVLGLANKSSAARARSWMPSTWRTSSGSRIQNTSVSSVACRPLSKKSISRGY